MLYINWNINHIAIRHQLVPDEVEQVCHGQPIFDQAYQRRLRVIGPSRMGRILTVILAPRIQGAN